ncbi:hypothetical protein GPECTOR_45g133 [Gonium pectorale]|uniref:Uncharacterized protein n=1 Tax=Gonium pectorale TaxID=33097 RepID=A0A150G920_GONPE|nr:hypothetical protein GPECTOR_45g133 [Gonium pectorale]|eukprot:KXZ46263.1 hypothetical protein GPECTOR_45g133 [Gonium pectorale]
MEHVQRCTPALVAGSRALGAAVEQAEFTAEELEEVGSAVTDQCRLGAPGGPVESMLNRLRALAAAPADRGPGGGGGASAVARATTAAVDADADTAAGPAASTSGG